MSTQSATSISFSITHPQEHIRLLELPPELLTILTAKADDDEADFHYQQLGGRIQLKSAPTNDVATSTKPKEQYLHLCTEDKVWAVRQVSTSNSVHICRTADDVPSLTNDDGAAALSNPAGGLGLTAFAQPTSTLELLPAPFTPSDIESAIQQLLPIQDLDDTTTTPPTPIISETELTASLPYPLYAILAAKRNLFVIGPRAPYNNSSTAAAAGDQTYTALPTPALLLAAWKCLFSLPDFNPDKDNLIGLGEHLSEIAMEENGGEEGQQGGGGGGEILACTARAIAEKFIGPPEDEEGLIELSGDDEHPELTRLKYSLEGKLLGRETAGFVGEMLVRTSTTSAGRGGGGGGKQKITVDELERQWAELVPEKWRGFCRIANLPAGKYVVEEDGTVSWSVGGQQGRGDNSAGSKPSGSSTVAAPAAAASNKRNWHEKFAAQRKK